MDSPPKEGALQRPKVEVHPSEWEWGGKKKQTTTRDKSERGKRTSVGGVFSSPRTCSISKKEGVASDPRPHKFLTQPVDLKV